MLYIIYRVPWGVAFPRPEAYAGCRVCYEGLADIIDVNIFVDVSGYDGASCRTVSGWKHSSTKAILAGVVFVKREDIDRGGI